MFRIFKIPSLCFKVWCFVSRDNVGAEMDVLLAANFSWASVAQGQELRH